MNEDESYPRIMFARPDVRVVATNAHSITLEWLGYDALGDRTWMHVTTVSRSDSTKLTKVADWLLAAFCPE